MRGMLKKAEGVKQADSRAHSRPKWRVTSGEYPLKLGLNQNWKKEGTFTPTVFVRDCVSLWRNH